MQTKKLTFGILYLLFPIFIFSCEKNKNEPTRLFQNESDLKGTVFKTELFKLNIPMQILVFDSLLIIHDNFEVEGDKYFFATLNRHNGKFINFFGREGKGPNEFLFPSYLSRIPGKKNHLGINNRQLFRFTDMHIEQALHGSLVQKTTTTKDFNVNFSVIVKVKENRFVGTGFFDKGRYAITKGNNQIINTDINYPFQNLFNDISLKSLGMAYQANLTVHPELPFVVSATMSSANLDILELRGDSLLLINSIHSNYPLFEDNSSTTRLSVNILPENKRGYQDIDATESYIYALYSGIEREEGLRKYRSGDKLLIFNWNGEPIKQFNLDTALHKIAVGPKDQTLYGIFINQDNQHLIKKYSLNL